LFLNKHRLAAQHGEQKNHARKQLIHHFGSFCRRCRLKFATVDPRMRLAQGAELKKKGRTRSGSSSRKNNNSWATNLKGSKSEETKSVCDLASHAVFGRLLSLRRLYILRLSLFDFFRCLPHACIGNAPLPANLLARKWAGRPFRFLRQRKQVICGDQRDRLRDLLQRVGTSWSASPSGL
jgi:hypothetical protein